MQIKNVKKTENGTYTMEVAASGVEMDYLVSFAVNGLIVAGAIMISENEDGSPVENQEVSLVGAPDDATIQ